MIIKNPPYDYKHREVLLIYRQLRKQNAYFADKSTLFLKMEWAGTGFGSWILNCI